VNRTEGVFVLFLPVSGRRGFTLIELLIVVAIIAILAAIAVPNFLEAQTRAKVSRCKADMRSTATGVEAYCVDNNKYPLYGRVTIADVVEPLCLGIGGMANPDKNEFVHTHLTTPIAYITTRFEDPFATRLPGPQPFMRYYDYMSIPYHFSLPGAPPPPVQRDILEKTGLWRLIACGPDRDRGADAKFYNLIYDPTNGTVSDGDIVRTQITPESVPRR
jgi:prepilin-type N-terminal cleavage/methylation domain-containing protein